MKNFTLVLTATVDPIHCTGMVLKDKIQREDSYSRVLEAYLNDGVAQIVFVENNNYDLSVFEKRFGKCKNLELITFSGNNLTHLYGKGQGENESITYALQNSIFLKKQSFFFKVAGRYHSSEIVSIMRDFDDQKFDGIFELIPQNQAASNVLTVFFGMHKNLYLDRISGAAVNDAAGLIFERVMFVNIQDLKIQWIDPILYDLTIVAGSGQEVTRFPAR